MRSAAGPRLDKYTRDTLVFATAAGAAGTWSPLVVLAVIEAAESAALLATEEPPLWTAVTIAAGGVQALIVGLIGVLPVLAVWGTGMILIGFPIWSVASCAGVRRLPAVLLIGAIAPGATCAGITFQAVSGLFPMAVPAAFVVGALGGVSAGLVIWLRTYRQRSAA